jgi:hypothetical protein
LNEDVRANVAAQLESVPFASVQVSRHNWKMCSLCIRASRGTSRKCSLCIRTVQMSRHDEKVSPLRPSGLTEQAYRALATHLPVLGNIASLKLPKIRESLLGLGCWLPLLVAAAAAAAALFPSHSPPSPRFRSTVSISPRPGALLLCCPAAPVFHSFRRTSPNPKPGSTQGLSRRQQESRTAGQANPPTTNHQPPTTNRPTAAAPGLRGRKTSSATKLRCSHPQRTNPWPVRVDHRVSGPICIWWPPSAMLHLSLARRRRSLASASPSPSFASLCIRCRLALLLLCCWLPSPKAKHGPHAGSCLPPRSVRCSALHALHALVRRLLLFVSSHSHNNPQPEPRPTSFFYLQSSTL